MVGFGVSLLHPSLSLGRLVWSLFLAMALLCMTAPEARAANLERGYLSDVQAEKEERFYEIFLFTTPPPKEKPLSDLIFNERLSKEFKEKYHEKFGQLDTETIVYQSSRFSILDDNRGAVLNIEQENQKRRQFGEYMIRRLIEWHVDNYFKTEPSMHAVYELKERLSHVEVAVTKETKLNAQYSFSDNSLDLIVDGPQFDISKITLQMDPKSFGPSPLQEEKLILEKNLTKKLRLASWVTAQDGLTSLESIRSLGANWSASVGLMAAFKSGGSSSRETKYLVGLGHSY